MTEQIIDADFSEVEDQKEQDKNIKIVSDPFSAAVTSICGIVNHITDSVKEYNMCRQQEETRRAAIKADLKVSLNKIEAQKEIMLREIDNRHELNLTELRNQHEITMKALDLHEKVISSAIITASETGDFSAVETFMKLNTEMINIRAELSMKALNSGLEDKSKDIKMLNG